ncbi:hypothetical protein GLYMA_04G162300v4 [Glycine max]|uniref:Uncharacterized protein n=1 Tax=Glycine max TaxID=3847 RepID=K7KKI5_SOYBN|nr:hypothetical protein JHK85_010693 [Glycine max]KAH1111633.1 hypothetical protein GYH30_010134 [Glycine max]KRH63229.1 hypothetical protein GLYMA_04G162300v4 [Glycine max]
MIFSVFSFSEGGKRRKEKKAWCETLRVNWLVEFSISCGSFVEPINPFFLCMYT